MGKARARARPHEPRRLAQAYPAYRQILCHQSIGSHLGYNLRAMGWQGTGLRIGASLCCTGRLGLTPGVIRKPGQALALLRIASAALQPEHCTDRRARAPHDALEGVRCRLCSHGAPRRPLAGTCMLRRWCAAPASACEQLHRRRRSIISKAPSDTTTKPSAHGAAAKAATRPSQAACMITWWRDPAIFTSHSVAQPSRKLVPCPASTFCDSGRSVAPAGPGCMLPCHRLAEVYFASSAPTLTGERAQGGSGVPLSWGSRGYAARCWLPSRRFRSASACACRCRRRRPWPATQPRHSGLCPSVVNELETCKEVPQTPLPSPPANVLHVLYTHRVEQVRLKVSLRTLRMGAPDQGFSCMLDSPVLVASPDQPGNRSPLLPFPVQRDLVPFISWFLIATPTITQLLHIRRSQLANEICAPARAKSNNVCNRRMTRRIGSPQNLSNLPETLWMPWQ